MGKTNILNYTIQKETHNFISDGNKIITRFPPGQLIIQSGYVIPEENLKKLINLSSRIINNTETDKNKKLPQYRPTTISKKINIQKHDVDLSQLQEKMAIVLTSKDKTENLHPNKSFSKYILSVSEKLEPYKKQNILEAD